VRKTLIGAGAAAAVLAAGGVAVAGVTGGGVPHAQPRDGSPGTLLSNGWSAHLIAQGSDALENPQGIYRQYGYLDDAASQPSGLKTKTEPDQNTYVVTDRNPGGPTAAYDYGRHFLIQGHEVFGAANPRAYLTRINLDVSDPAHRITLLNTPDASNRTGISSIDGSTYDPFSKKLLFTAEAGSSGGVVSTPVQWQSAQAPALTKHDGSMGRGGYEGIHPDNNGNVVIVEDVGGSSVTGTSVKQPNSFVYRFKPSTPGDLDHGRLQALQVSVDDSPITFHAADRALDALGEPIRRLHSGEELQAQWITVHDTAVDGTTAFDANALAKAKGATPLKRPENGKYVPGTGFRSFVFDETGDTNANAGNYHGAAERGAWGALLRLDMPEAGADHGTIRTLLVGDAGHSGFDNVAFLDGNTVLAAEDRGDTLHQQLNALDSIWAFDINKPRPDIVESAKRLIAQGRDPEATEDANRHDQGLPDQNDGDNEITGIHVSDGSTSVDGILGAADPAKLSGVRIFVTGQHGANKTYELTSRPTSRP
jgi:hypothetical protein